MLALIFFLGEFTVHIVAGGALKLGSRVMSWTRDHATGGLAGSIGFCCLMIGFSLQAVGALS